MITELHINGEDRKINADPETPLLYVLRNHLKLTGTRYGCGLAQCGACAVLVDGKEVRSCVTTIAGLAGHKIVTIEGLAGPDGKLHPVQQAWIDEQVPQCGYCQSGMIIAAVELLSRNPDPSVVEIKEAFTNQPPSPHLCRCGTYSAIIDAVRLAARTMRA